MIQKHNTPWAYFLTFRTYATFLHGDSRLSVDKRHNIFGTDKIPHKPNLLHIMKKQCAEAEFILTNKQQEIVLTSICKTSAYFNWSLIAAHVRTNHIHALVRSTINKEKTLAKLKAYATQALKTEFPELHSRKKFWSTHGSTKLIWHEEAVFPVMHYIIAEQGKPTALYYDEKLYASFDPKLYEILRG